MVEQTLMISSPGVQPFGLLSNKALVEIKVGQHAVPNPKYSFKHGSWKTVTQYVYVNMFKNEIVRHRMSEMLAPNPFVNMMNLREQEDISVYNTEIVKGLNQRFKQREELRTRLYQTRGKQLVYDNKEILTVLNNIRLQNRQVVYDPKQNKEIPRVEVLQAIAGVEEQILKNPSSIPDTLDFVDLKRYSKRYGYGDLPLNDEIFLNVNYIVPILKHRLRERLWSKDLQRFKDHLLDVFLDDTLEEEYPNLDESEYTEAKQQQISKEPRIHVYKDQLYDLYVKGMKGDKNIRVLEKLRFTPDKTLREIGRNAREIDDKLLTPEAHAEKIYIQPDDPFLPHYIEDVTMDGKTYASAVHYAYARMITNLIETGEMPGLETFDINTVDLKNIVETYNAIKKGWIYYNLKANNEVAIGMKVEQHPIIAHLLLATNGVNIVWNDRSDPVLGVGGDGRGENNTGHLFKYVRDAYMRINIPNRIISSYGSIANNIWTNSWMMSMAGDFKNTLILMKSPRTADLEAIYNITGVNGTPGTDDVESLHKTGLNDEQIAIVFPMIAALYIPMRSKTEKVLMDDEATTYFMENNYKGKKREFDNDFGHAVSRLEKISDSLLLADDVNKRKFVMSILGNKQTTDEIDVRWNRVYKWSH
jgi:predicted NAD-dependent protein-ADP-ribosyltransferase YbiA (DUF1768 family)